MTTKSDKPPAPEPTEHLGLLLGKCEKHGGQHVVFEREGEVHEGVIKPFVEGQSISPDDEIVEVATDGPLARIKSYGKTGRATSSGPAMVNDAKYKAGWDRIFGSKKPASKDLN